MKHEMSLPVAVLELYEPVVESAPEPFMKQINNAVIIYSKKYL